MQYDRRQHAARHTNDYVFHQLLPYLGNKRHLLDLIGQALAATGIAPGRSTFVDAFAGSGVVSRFAKQVGFAVVSNDWEPYAEALNTAAIACEGPPACSALGGYDAAIRTLNALPGTDGWVTAHLCPADDLAPDPVHERLFYRRATGRRLDAIRAQIATWQASGAIDAASNGTALHRILADLQLQPQRFLATGRAHRVYAVDAVALGTQLTTTPDVVYLDPPYNQHPYASNYHVLNSLVVWDQPALPPPTARGWKAAIRPDWRQRKSAFNDRRGAAAAFAALFDRFDAPWLLVSYSTDGTLPLERLVALAAGHGAVRAFCRRYKRYRTSPTRPSPRPRNVEFVLAIDRRRRAEDGGAAALAAIRAHEDAVDRASDAAATSATR